MGFKFSEFYRKVNIQIQMFNKLRFIKVQVNFYFGDCVWPEGRANTIWLYQHFVPRIFCKNIILNFLVSNSLTKITVYLSIAVRQTFQIFKQSWFQRNERIRWLHAQNKTDVQTEPSSEDINNLTQNNFNRSVVVSISTWSNNNN